MGVKAPWERPGVSLRGMKSWSCSNARQAFDGVRILANQANQQCRLSIRLRATLLPIFQCTGIDTQIASEHPARCLSKGGSSTKSAFIAAHRAQSAYDVRLSEHAWHCDLRGRAPSRGAPCGALVRSARLHRAAADNDRTGARAQVPARAPCGAAMELSSRAISASSRTLSTHLAYVRRNISTLWPSSLAQNAGVMPAIIIAVA